MFTSNSQYRYISKDVFRLVIFYNTIETNYFIDDFTFCLYEILKMDIFLFISIPLEVKHKS